MLEIEGVEYQYPHSDFHLRVPQLIVPQGAKVAFVGPSGSGKTTLLSLLSGVIVPTRGRIRVDDVEVTSMSDAQRRDFRCARVGMVFQDFELIEYLNVHENILLPYRINRRLRLTADVSRTAQRLAESAGIASYLRRRISRLSHGERQRVALCRALLTQPDLLLADEPTGSLDPTNKERVVEMLFEHVATTQATLIVVTHDHGVLDGFDHVVDFASFHALDGSPALQPAEGKA